MPPMRLLQLPGALWALFRLGWATRFRLNGKYWTWRRETAFGVDPQRMPSARARRDAVLEYAHWVRCMGRMR